MENELEALEANYASLVRTDMHNELLRQDQVPERKILLEKLLAKVKKYSECNEF